MLSEISLFRRRNSCPVSSLWADQLFSVMALAQQGVPVLPKPVCELCGVLAPSFAPFPREGRLFLVGLFWFLKFKLKQVFRREISKEAVWLDIRADVGKS